jgi:hypothetical protein
MTFDDAMADLLAGITAGMLHTLGFISWNFLDSKPLSSAILLSSMGFTTYTGKTILFELGCFVVPVGFTISIAGSSSAWFLLPLPKTSVLAMFARFAVPMAAMIALRRALN